MDAVDAVAAVDVGVVVAESVVRREEFGEPFFLQWNITDACNLECSHCYRDQPIEDLDLAALLSVLEDFKAFLGGIERAGRVMLSGGEPLASPYIFDLAEACRAKSLPVRVLSNGTLIDPVAARSLADVGVRAVQVSIEGPERMHDAIRGAGSYAAALDGVRALREAGLKVTLAFTLTSANRSSLPAVARLARRNADRFHVARHVPIGRGVSADVRALTARELERTMRWLDARRRIWRARGPQVPMRDPLWKALTVRGPSCEACVAGCSIGYNGICVDADGGVYPCRRLPIRLGTVPETSLTELWGHRVLQQLRDRDALEGRCGRCDIRWVCGGCRAVAEALNAHPMAEDPQCFRRLPRA